MVTVLNAVAIGLMRLLRIPEPDQRLALYTSAELEIVTDEAADSGQLGAMQRDLIRNIFDLEERRAEELMTSRTRMQVLDVTATPEEVAARIAASPRSRYPIVDGDLDHVVGVLHIKDFIRASQRGRPSTSAAWPGRCPASRPARPPTSCWPPQARPDPREPGRRRVRRHARVRDVGRRHRRGHGRPNSATTPTTRSVTATGRSSWTVRPP
jgi:hypothetical protein